MPLWRYSQAHGQGSRSGCALPRLCSQRRKQSPEQICCCVHAGTATDPAAAGGKPRVGVTRSSTVSFCLGRRALDPINSYSSCCRTCSSFFLYFACLPTFGFSSTIRTGFGCPTRSRALAFTAFVAENFAGFLLVIAIASIEHFEPDD
jgi:hypothetical protein